MPNPNFKAMLVDGINIEYKLKDSQIKIQTDKDEVLLNIASDLEELDDCL